MISFFFLLGAGPVLLFRNDLGIRFPEVAEAGAFFVSLRNLLPQLPERDVVTRSVLLVLLKGTKSNALPNSNRLISTNGIERHGGDAAKPTCGLGFHRKRERGDTTRESLAGG